MRKSITTYGCYFFLISFSLLLVQCAQIVVPSGGDRDTAPPKVEKFIPDSAAVNFNAKTITLVFDEYIQLSDLQKEMTISPPMRIQPEVRAKGKMLQIELKDTLKKNTTYVINFGSSIRDFTESNPKTDFRYIFSTGDHIDTLKLTGTVNGAYDQKTEKGILVMLYESLDDSVPYKSGPSYFAKTNADGTYKISNIKPGKYKAFALKDANGNSKYDAPTESIAFSDTLIRILKNVKLDLRLFVEEPQKQSLLKKYMAGYGRMMLIYAKPVKKLSCKALNSTTKTETFLTEYLTNRDSIRIWFPVFSKDPLYFLAIADDNTIDTVRINTDQFQRENSGRGEEFKLTATLNVKKDAPFDLNRSLEIFFNHPIISFLDEYYGGLAINKNKDKRQSFQLREDSLEFYEQNIPEANPSSLYYWQKWVDFETRRHLKLDKVMPFNCDEDSLYVLNWKANSCFMNVTWKENTKYSLVILPASFTDIFGLVNDTIKLDFKTQEEKYYGTLKLTLKHKIRIAYVLELVNEKGQVFNYSSSDKSIFSYEYLPPGAYRLRIIYDQNGDGKWTTGKYSEKRKPETIIYYSGAVTIRSNWDLELDWKVE